MGHAMSDGQAPKSPESEVDPHIFMQPTPRPKAEEPLFRPRQPEGVGGLTVGLLLAVVVVGLFAVGPWLWRAGSAPARLEAPVVSPPAPVPTPVAATASAEKQTDGALPETPVVRRCTNASGDITYSDEPCPDGAKEIRVATDDALKVAGAPGASTLYRCKGAGLFWSMVHCQHRGAQVVGMHTVPANMALADQILLVQGRQASNRPARRVADAAPAEPLNAARMKAQDCKRLDQRIAALDAYARHALSAGEQDRVRGERQGYRDQQFRLRCGR